MHSTEPNPLDQVIDRALASYIEVQPSPNLEHQVLANLHRATRHRYPIWLWALATPLLAASLIFLIARYTDHRVPVPQPVARKPVIQPISTAAPKPAPALTGSIGHPRSMRRSRHTPSAEALPEQPLLLVNSEQALLNLTRNRLSPVSEPTPQPVQPIQIAALQIKPLNTEEESK